MLCAIKRYGWFFTALLVVMAVCCAGNPDNDSAFLIATGRFIFENGHVPHDNPFVIHDMTMVVQQPLACLYNFFWYSILGNAGIQIGACVVVLTAILSLGFLVSALTSDARTKLVIVTILMLTVMLGLYTTRPQGITFSILCIELRSLLLYARDKDERYLLVLPLLALFQANWHMSFFPLLFVFPAVFVCTSHMSFAERIRILLVCGFMILLGVISPNGVDGYFYLFSGIVSIASSGIRIEELVSPTYLSLNGIFLLIFIVLTVVYAVKFRGVHDVRTFVISAIAIIFTMYAMRNIWWCAFGAVLMLTNMQRQGAFSSLSRAHLDRISSTLFALMSVGIALYACILIADAIMRVDETVDRHVDHAALSEILSEADDPVIFADFNTGAAFELMGYRVYIDARPEIYDQPTVFSESLLDEFVQMSHMDKCTGIDYDSFIEAYGFDYMLIDSSLTPVLAEHAKAREDLVPSWSSDDGSVVFYERKEPSYGDQ